MQAVLHAPLTRPDRYTILEHLELDEAGGAGAGPRVRRGPRVTPSIAELRAADAAGLDLRPQQRRALGRAAVHAAALAVPDAAADPHAADAERRHVADDRGRLRGRRAAHAARACWPALGAVVLIQLQLLLDCSDGELARWRGVSSPAGIYLDRMAHNLTEAALPIALGDPRRRRLGLARRLDDARAADRGAGAARAGRVGARLRGPRRGGPAGGRGHRAVAAPRRGRAGAGAAGARASRRSSARSWRSSSRSWRCWPRSGTRWRAISRARGRSWSVLVPVAAMIAVGRLAAILASQRLR